MTSFLPGFYQPEQVSQLFVERAGAVAESAQLYARKHGVKPSARDTFRIAAFGIDVEQGLARAMLGKQARNGAAHARSCSGDDDPAPFEFLS